MKRNRLNIVYKAIRADMRDRNVTTAYLGGLWNYIRAEVETEEMNTDAMSDAFEISI